MNYRKWVVQTLVLFLSPLILIGGFNYFIDPLWMFEHSNPYNDFQVGFNERQQKTNFITFNDFDYDTLILGTSRTTYLNQDDFVGYKAYNYAVNAMRVEEYNDYIEYAKKRNGKDFDYIVLELFYRSFDTSISKTQEAPSYYINQANRPFYRISSLLGLDTLTYSIKNALASTKQEFIDIRMYDRNNVAFTDQVSEEEALQIKNNFVENFNYKTPYQSNYDDKYQQTLKEIKENNPNTKFIIFTNPPQSYFLKAHLRDEEGLADYERWLRDMVSVFGTVFNFTYLNTVTNNVNYYYDSQHFYPEIGTWIIHRIIEYPNSEIPNDFGVKVNKDNLEEHLAFVRGQFG